MSQLLDEAIELLIQKRIDEKTKTEEVSLYKRICSLININEITYIDPDLLRLLDDPKKAVSLRIREEPFTKHKVLIGIIDKYK